MAAADLDEQRIALGRPDRREMADGPDGEADQPEAQAEADAPASVPFRMARRAARRRAGSARSAPGGPDGEARHVFGRARHQTSAPPPNEKNDRKKLDAAKAIDRPNTIWISRRKPPTCRRTPASGRW
jgi:hypothetical protein